MDQTIHPKNKKSPDESTDQPGNQLTKHPPTNTTQPPEQHPNQYKN